MPCLVTSLVHDLVISLVRDISSQTCEEEGGIPPNALLDGEGNPLLDENNNYILT
jgi:hypothetical protein